MDDIKLFVNNEKELETLIQAVMIYNRDKMWHRKMCHANNKKQKTRNDGCNRTTKSRKSLNAWGKGNIQVLGNIESGYI